MSSTSSPSQRPRVVLAGALGEDAHVAGIAHFLGLAAECGWRTVYLGAAVPVRQFLDAIRAHDPALVAVSYRLTPETGETLLRQFIDAARADGLVDRRFAFGGTPPLAARAATLGFFERCFAGDESPADIAAWLRDRLVAGATEQDFPQTFRDRLAWKFPVPLLRHHFGRPTVAETDAGIAQIAETAVLDVVSLGIDQDAQENFYHPERQDLRRAGAGGVPCRTEEDYRRLYAASRRGNYPLLRAYSGTDDHLRLAQMYVDTIHNAGAPPRCSGLASWTGAVRSMSPTQSVSTKS